ncbi:uncharacterized protein Dsimw501_GD27155 [Drosophila simulans]|uniref:Uncharacterized protein n=1 Tax=Drosophila simulans TaxID=7240 RepID=A0A0J9REH1_DROSI|nr:uncharacterized protein Dsimw501_GD27155 [Drosophila simulans]
MGRRLETSVHIRSSTGCKHVLGGQLPPNHFPANFPIYQASICPAAMQIGHAFRITKNYTFIKFRVSPWKWGNQEVENGRLLPTDADKAKGKRGPYFGIMV